MLGIFTLFLLILLIVGKPYLFYSQEPIMSDAIIVLSGGAVRLEKGIALFEQGYADYIILSNAMEDGIDKKDPEDQGIPKDKFILEKKASSTYTNAVYTKEEMENLNLKSAIVVSSDYHMRRTKLVFDRVYKNSGIQLTYVAAETMSKVWYPNTKENHFIISEWLKLVGYYFQMYKFD